MPELAISFSVTGPSLMRARKTLKPAYPKKKLEAASTIEIVSLTLTEVAFQLPGASARVETKLSNLFKCQMPWILFKQTFLDDYSKSESVELKIGAGFFTCGFSTLRSDQIVFQLLDSGDTPVKADPQEGADAPMPDLVNAPLGFPLLSAYAYMRKHGFREYLANKGFVQMERDVLFLVSKATKSLEPLGVTREDIEKLIDQKFGIAGSTPIDGTTEPISEN